MCSGGCKIIGSEAGARRAARLARFGNRVIHVEPVRKNPELGIFTRVVKSAPKPSERTEQLLRRYNLSDKYKKDPSHVVRWLNDICTNSPTMNEVHALAEIALIQGNWAAQNRRTEKATEYYATAMVQAYQFLFDSKHNLQRNAYDPQFRRICDVYNESLEGILRVSCKGEKFRPGTTHTIGTGDMEFTFTVQMAGRWKQQNFTRFELTNDYEMKGISNLYHTYGLGVPLIAVHDSQELRDKTEKYYPPSLSLPFTAFCEVLPKQKSGKGRQATITLYDPLERTTLRHANRTVPLESDVTTPLAYQLNDPLLNSGVLATASMINATLAKDLFGLYMLEPFDPDKIPVVMVHGLWSSPTTWMEMFNDLRANRELRKNYQFWFYAYPTGQPFWHSARQMRYDLAEARRDLDPQDKSSKFNKMVLVGHSMGGLVSRLQTINSEDKFWDLVSQEDFDSLRGDQASLKMMRDTFFFEPDPSVKRVITIASPHRGSSLANHATQWISQRLFTLPETITNDFKSVARDNESAWIDRQILTTTTSIDSLSPNSPFISVLAGVEADSDVKYHNIMGRLNRNGLFKPSRDGDGVVDIDSARIDYAESEVVVTSEHSEVHQHPLAILEVRRILLEHLQEYGILENARLPVIPTDFEQANPATSSNKTIQQAVYEEP